jgi:hypothetical protein
MLAAFGLLAGFAAAQEPVRIPQTALSRCPPLQMTQSEDVAPGTGLAVSADGRYLALFFHTPGGAEIALRDRDTSEVRRLRLSAPQLPPGMLWRITEARFTPVGDRFAVASVGKVWMFVVATGELLFEIGTDEQQRFPGQLSLGGERLALVFWPAESYLAAARPAGQVNVRLYDAGNGNEAQNLFLPITTADAWTRLELSPDAAQLAVLMRPTRWPGKARLALFTTSDGARLWEKKIGAEDLAWSADLGELLVLGSELQWLDARNAKRLRAADKKLRFSEFQKLRASEPVNLAAGFFMRYNPLKRALALTDWRDPQFRLWQLDRGRTTCQIDLDQSVRVDAWPTARGELIALEETYDVRPELRILRAARIVTYRVSQ